MKDHRRGVLDNGILAQIAGYSECHFFRIFRKTVYLTPADYIRKHRISEVVRRIGERNRPMSDIAFKYDLNSGENFTRAFKNEHHIPPSEFRTANCSLRLLSRLYSCQNGGCIIANGWFDLVERAMGGLVKCYS